MPWRSRCGRRDRQVVSGDVRGATDRCFPAYPASQRANLLAPRSLVGEREHGSMCSVNTTAMGEPPGSLAAPARPPPGRSSVFAPWGQREGPGRASISADLRTDGLSNGGNPGTGTISAPIPLDYRGTPLRQPGGGRNLRIEASGLPLLARIAFRLKPSPVPGGVRAPLLAPN